jgi:hypothetical protein
MISMALDRNYIEGIGGPVHARRSYDKTKMKPWGLPRIIYSTNLRWSGWLTYGVVESRIFEGVKIWITEKICRPGLHTVEPYGKTRT